MAKFIKKAEQAIKLNQLLNKRAKLFNWLAMLLAVIIGYFLILSPNLAKINDLQKLVLPAQEAELEILKKYEAKIAELQKLSADYENKNQTNLEKLENVLPSAAELPKLIAQLEAVSRQNNFRIMSLEIGEGESSSDKAKEEASLSGLKPVDIILQINGGGYFEFKTLLNNLENHLRLLDVISISFESSLEETSYSLILRAYYLAKD